MRDGGQAGSPASRRRNWPLAFGVGIVLVAVLIAAFGPGLAPRDPLTPTFIIQNSATGKFVKPPFPAFTVPGFPLGTDSVGRDTWSQLLWAVRPTLIMVIMVAGIRLVLGLLAGLLAGWSARWPGKLADAAISAAVAIPVLIVALFTIALLGPDLGLWGFVTGLSLTGWAEPARLIREQTRIVRSHPFVEAARVLGGKGSDSVFRHVLPHIMPMVWMLLAFEVSSTLMAAAGLGLLGHFVYSIWVPLGDWSAVRGAGRPELGQMLAGGAAMVLRQPWLLLAAGTAIAILVLGFNLLGEGLRQAGERGPTSSAILGLVTRLGERSQRVGRSVPQVVAAGFLIVLTLGGGYLLWRASAPPAAEPVLEVPGGHSWAAEGRDPQGTYWSAAPGPRSNRLVWRYRTNAPFAAGPSVAADGTVYVAAVQGNLHAISAAGRGLWQAQVPGDPYGTPTLDGLGRIYLLDTAGSLHAYTADGDYRWTAITRRPARPLAGLSIDGDGNIYFVTETTLASVDPEGVFRWQTGLPTYSYTVPSPRLTPDGRLLLFEDILLDPATGEILHDATFEAMDRYVIGASGGLYERLQGEILTVKLAGADPTYETYARWDLISTNLGFRQPFQAGVAPDGRVWVNYSSPYDSPKLAWIDRSGEVLSIVDLRWRPGSGILIGFDNAGWGYGCGLPGGEVDVKTLDCRAIEPGRSAPSWTFTLPESGAPAGGALGPGRLYVATVNGQLLAIGD